MRVRIHDRPWVQRVQPCPAPTLGNQYQSTREDRSTSTSVRSLFNLLSPPRLGRLQASRIEAESYPSLLCLADRRPEPVTRVQSNLKRSLQLNCYCKAISAEDAGHQTLPNPSLLIDLTPIGVALTAVPASWPLRQALHPIAQHNY